ncbi:ABC transporter substrate-binding protein [Variovorax sp. J2P1-59]|uniref:ABC transporter substrate-binding protein n=1 Tax=Variovorax flavidus TaxID=3053501 RepID=UPI0025782A3D|nr:ABC transporter substrate-binding protein [Variovorax sp. J2P1-59]MDM0078745.1 ABC transporter substrate-binding protein [Variovorax sp. J2P1-59]
MSIATRMTRRTALQGLAACAGALALPAFSQAPVKAVFGYTAVTDFATVFVAREEGYFTKRGIEVEPKQIPLNPSIPPAIESDSLQLGGPTPSVYLQGVEGGLDHVVLTGGGATSKSMTGIGLVAKAGSNIKTAQDCVGKKIGVPGLGAFLHVGFRAWLKSQGVDYTKVTFVEAAFPQHGDLLRGGSLDAVVTADPFMARIIASGAGYVASYYSTFLPDGLPTLVFTARRDWVQKNPAAAKAFQGGIAEAAAFINNPKNNAKVREHIGKYIKLPPEVLATAQLSPPLPVVQEPQLGWWADQMLEQKLLKAKPAMASLIVK